MNEGSRRRHRRGPRVGRRSGKYKPCALPARRAARTRLSNYLSEETAGWQRQCQRKKKIRRKYQLLTRGCGEVYRWETALLISTRVSRVSIATRQSRVPRAIGESSQLRCVPRSSEGGRDKTRHFTLVVGTVFFYRFSSGSLICRDVALFCELCLWRRHVG